MTDVHYGERRTLVRRGEVGVRLLLAALLLTAATLKGLALWSQPFSSDFLLGSRTAELGVIYGEMLLAFWLLSGWQWPFAWFASLTLFVAFALRSGWQTWEGHSSCGCFGKVEVAPWVTLLLDLFAVKLLLLVRPGAGGLTRGLTPAARRFAIPVATAALLLAVAFTYLSWQAGSAFAALASLRGDFLTLTPALADLGSQSPGSRGETRIAVHNHGPKPIRIVGGTSDCSCATTADLPATIPPGGSATIRIQVKFGQQMGRFQRGYWLWTDAKEQPQAIAWFTGRVQKGEPPASAGGSQ